MIKDLMNIPETLKNALKHGKVIPFVGSGISHAVQRKNFDGKGSFNPLFPSWGEYLEILATALDNRDRSAAANYVRDCLNNEPPDYLGAMQVAFDKLGEADWDSLLDRHFDFEENEADDPSLELARLTWQVSNNLIITTNIDRVLQWTCPNPKEFKILESQKKEFGKLNKEYPPKCPTVVYFHGHIDNKANILFTKEQYDYFYNYRNNEAKLETLKVLLAQSTFLFLGFSLDDPYFLKQLRYFHNLYEGGADSFFVLIHKNEKDNPNIPEFVRKIVFEDYGEPLLSLIKQLVWIREGGAGTPKTDTLTSRIPPRSVSAGSISSGIEELRKNDFTFQSLIDPGPIDSVAVLPFQITNSDPDANYLSDGLTKSLIYRLSQLQSLKVSPTSSVFRYKGREADATKIGRELGVKAVVSGLLAQRGESLIISVELVDVRNDKLIWGELFDRKLSELLITQREIATEITQNLKLKLAVEGRRALTKRYTNSNEAYQLYLKGNFYFAKRTKDNVLRGIDYFKQAILRDPDFALAYFSIANSYNAALAYAYVSPKEALPQAKAAAVRAVELDMSLAEAHAALAYSLVLCDWDWAVSEREFKLALELNPNDDEIHFRYGMIYLMSVGRTSEAIEELKQALDLEPLSLVNNSILASVYLYGRQYERALEQARAAYDLESSFVLARWNLGYTYIVNRMYAEAITLSQQSLQIDPTSQFMLRIAGIAYAKSGRKSEAEKVIRRFKNIGKTQYVSFYYVASIYVALGNKDKAFVELEKSFAEPDWDLHRLKVDPFMDPLRNDPRFEEMLKRLNLSE